MNKFVVRKPRLENITESEIQEEIESEDNIDENEHSKRIRKFRAEWLQKYPWLENRNGTAYCKACDKSVVNLNYHLSRHEKCTLHLKNMESKSSQILINTFLDKEKDSLDKMVKFAEFTMVMFLVAHNLPFLLMDYLPNLLSECCPDSEVAKRLKCARTKAVKVTEEISKAATNELVSTLKSCKFSIIIDETTDVSLKKCLVLVARYCKNFIVRDRFLALLELSNCDAGSIFDSIKSFFQKNEIPLKNIVGLATDGASVMAGHLSGVKSLFELQTNIFYLKCTCHSLHLCASYACKQLPQRVDWLCRNIYSFFSHIPKRVHNFKEFQDYCSVKPHKILGLSQTRWLSLEGVVSRINEQWDCLRLFFINCKLEVNAVRSAELAEEMNNEMKVYFLFLSYVLPLINNLNKDFQSEQSRLPYLYSNIKTHYMLILSNFIKKAVLHVDIDYKDSSNYIEVSKFFIGTKSELFLSQAKATPSEIIKIKSIILKFYIELLDQIRLRFDFERKDLELLKIITPTEVMSNNENSILDLILHFQNLCDMDSDKIVTQWTLLRLSDHRCNSDMDINSFWEKISTVKNGLGELMFPDLSNFIFLLLSLPHSSAAAERKFSSVKLIKTDIRSRLETKTVHNIMVCKELISKQQIWSAKRDFFTKMSESEC